MNSTHSHGRSTPGAPDEPSAAGAPTPDRASRRRRPRKDVVTYRLTIDLDGVVPRVWRTIEVASDLRLDALHTVFQVALGWTDSHLHAFAVGDTWHDPQTERFAMAGDAGEGFEGDVPETPEADVRLDELVQDVGDILLYTYDFGDGWDHTARLDAVLPRPSGAPAALCAAGGGKCPPEDCGGVPGYEELLADAADPTRIAPHEFDDFLQRMEWLFPGVALSGIAAAAQGFDPAPVNVELARPPLPAPLRELLDRAHGPGREVLANLIERARVDQAVLVDSGVAARMVEPFAWLVEYVGSRGLPLTAAGYLKPAAVGAVVDALGFRGEWIGMHNRESQTYPVLLLRQAAQKVGLLRVAKGQLTATRVGLALIDDPVGLWWHLAARLPVVGRPDERDSGFVYLLAAAAKAHDEEQAAVMAAIGWVLHDGSPLTAADVRRGAGLTRSVLERMGGLDRVDEKGRLDAKGWNERPNRDGTAFARAALRVWP